MVERWKEAGRPLGREVRHPFADWARTVGGILRVSGFTDFLANYAVRRTADDPVRQALALLGSSRPSEWLRPGEWARQAMNLGLGRALFAAADADGTPGRERATGVLLSVHQKETFAVETENRRLVLQLERTRRRFASGEEPTVRYRFQVVREEPIPEDATPGGAAPASAQARV